MRHCLVALTLALFPVGVWASELTLIGKYDLHSDVIMGVSGLEVSADGKSFIAVADRGWWLTGEFKREGERIQSAEISAIMPILGSNSHPVAARRVGDWSDAEGLAAAADGEYFVSFERWTRVARFSDLSASANSIKDHPSFYDYFDNMQLEAVAVNSDGEPIAIPERPLKDGFPVYRLTDDHWVIDRHIPESDLFGIVGADFGRNGMLYILERKLVLGTWWQCQIRTLNTATGEIDILWRGARGAFGNLEGISYWEDDIGPRLTLVSDNNGNGDPTQFVEFRLTD